MSLMRHRELLPWVAAPRLPAAAPRAPAARARSDADPISAVLYLWLCGGTMGSALFPSLRGFDPILGWWPFWLLLWPATSMLLWRLHGRLGRGRRASRQG